MAESKKLVWDADGERLYETGVKEVALYVYDAETKKYGVGKVWNGVTAITESPSGAEATPLYADDDKYLNLISKEEFACTLEAYMYPDAFEECDGTATLGTGVTIGQQPRKTFALAYVTTVGNDKENNAYGEKLHIIYGCVAAPSEKSYSTINDSPEAITFSWTINTTPVEVTGHNKTATVCIDKKKAGAKYQTIKDKLQGSTTADPTLLFPDEIKALLAA